MTNQQIVDQLKSSGAVFAAGAAAYTFGLGPAYGCHFGMRNTRTRDAADFEAGYDAAALREHITA